MKTALFKFALVGFLLLTSGLFPNPAHSLIDSGEVPAGWAVWSSWYWPWHDSYNPNLYDPGEAMERYDDYDIGANAQSWEYQYHGPLVGSLSCLVRRFCLGGATHYIQNRGGDFVSGQRPERFDD